MMLDISRTYLYLSNLMPEEAAVIKISFDRDSHLNIKHIFLSIVENLTCRLRLSVCPHRLICRHCVLTSVSMQGYNGYIWHINKHVMVFFRRSVCPQSVSQEAPWIWRKGFWAAENWVQQHWYWPLKSKGEPSTGRGLIRVSLPCRYITHRVSLCSAQEG